MCCRHIKIWLSDQYPRVEDKSTTCEANILPAFLGQDSEYHRVEDKRDR